MSVRDKIAMFTPPKGPATGAALKPRNSGDFAGRTLQTLHAARSLRKVTPKKPASPSLEAGPTLEEQRRDVRAHIKTRTLGVLDELLGMPNADFFAKPVDWRALGLHDYPEVVEILETCEKNREHSVGIMLSRFSKNTWSPPDRPTRRVGSDSTVRQPGPPPTECRCFLSMQVIRRPMDLGTIRFNVERGRLIAAEEIQEAAHLVFANAVCACLTASLLSPPLDRIPPLAHFSLLPFPNPFSLSPLPLPRLATPFRSLTTRPWTTTCSMQRATSRPPLSVSFG